MCGPTHDITKILIYATNPEKAVAKRSLLKNTTPPLSVDTIINDCDPQDQVMEHSIFVHNLAGFYTHMFIDEHPDIDYSLIHIARALYREYDVDAEILPLDALTKEKASHVAAEIANRLREQEANFIAQREYRALSPQQERLATLRARHRCIGHKAYIELPPSP